jgi:hypothetical protein
MKKVRSLLKLNLDLDLSLFRSAILQKIFIAISDMLGVDVRITRNGCPGAC